MENWKDKVLVGQLDELRPPAFLLSTDEEGEPSESKRRSTVVREHYTQLHDFLEEHAYLDLVKMAERIRTRRSEIETRSSVLIDSRGYYVRVQYIAFQRMHPEMEVDSFPADTGDRQSSLDEPIGKAWLDEDGSIKTDGGWTVETDDHNDASKTPLSSMEISLPPEAVSASHSKAGSSGKVNFEKVKSRIDPEDLQPSDQFKFTGDTTWSEVIDAFEHRLSSFAEDKDRINRVRELLGFRAEIARVVLSRFEMLGEVPEMTEEDASGLANQTDEAHPERIMTWQENAAYLYAYLQKHERPESMNALEENSGVSVRQAWDQLKKRDYGAGRGVSGLIGALKEWAPEFENHYGIEKARNAAWPSEWPEEHER